MPYLVMRLMLGGTLTKRVDDGPVPMAETVTITNRICEALDKAHTKGIIHRDIKPSNILFDDDGYSYLGDFGIVKIAETTLTTQMIGTPEYMSPEQIENRLLDRRADVYQMGIVLFEMLTGRQLYTAESPIAVLFKHVQAPIPAIQESNPPLPASCQDVINKALAKNPENRFATTGELASALEQATFQGGWSALPTFDDVPFTNTYIDEKTGLDMIHIPAGTFLYGNSKQPRELPRFWISKTPVTNAQYTQFASVTGHDSPQHWQGKTPKAALANHPVTQVSWHDAQAYAGWAGMHLPTEEEWENAARGTDGRVYPWGDEWRDGYCNTREAGMGSTTPVGLYSPQGDSLYGCVDMAGNVWEWTESWYDEEEKYRVVCGGSWNYFQNLARAAARGYSDPHDRGSDNGFRVVARRSPSR